MTIVDSGERTEFQSGAVRDMKEGKGRCDLMPLYQISQYCVTDGWIEGSIVFERISDFLRSGDVDYLYLAINDFCKSKRWSTAEMLLDLSKHFEEGAKKYGEHNWERGIPESSYIDSAIRHYLKFWRGDNDERHDVAFVWNLMCLAWTHENIK